MKRALLLFLISLPLAISKCQYKDPILKEKYDYIIVGAGTAGSVLANRLSEDKATTVLLLEAGGPPPEISEIPVFTSLLQRSTEDWMYETVPQNNSYLAFENRVSPVARYKALGGSSCQNNMIYARGNKRDYDEWDRNGARGWSWKDVFPYFKKSEDQTDPTLQNNGYHGTGGYQTVSTLKYLSKSGGALINAAEKYLCIQYGDYNGANQSVISKLQLTQRDGLRCSSEKAFLRPVANRTNLDILTYAHVRKVNIDSKMTARSVTFDYNNKCITISSRREIVLSAGAIGTPQLMMISGIGPKTDLQKLGIPLVADLPVGQNLQNHVGAFAHFLVNDSSGFVTSRDINPENIGLLEDGEGRLTSPGTLEVVAFFKSKHQNCSDDRPKIQILTSASMLVPSPYILKQQYLKEFKKHSDSDAVTFQPILISPKSKGYLKLRSSDIYDRPDIDPRYLSEQLDVDILVEGLKIIDSWIQAPEFQKFNPQRIFEMLPGCEGLAVGSDDYYECVVRTLTGTANHVCCACKMGDPNDPSTVVDPELRVKGIPGLRVVGTSIMPNIVSGDTNAACLMIAEKAADMIRCT